MCEYCEGSVHGKFDMCKPILNQEICSYNFMGSKYTAPLYNLSISIIRGNEIALIDTKNGIRILDTLPIKYCPICGKKTEKSKYMYLYTKEWYRKCSNCNHKYITYKEWDNCCPNCNTDNSIVYNTSCEACMIPLTDQNLILKLNDYSNEGENFEVYINKRNKSLSWNYKCMFEVPFGRRCLGQDWGSVTIKICPFCGEIL
jgi:hypothetical protein